MPDLLPLAAATRSFFTFRLGPRLYGIDVLQVREVVPRLPMTPVPQAPAAVCGLFNLRSRIYLALDIKILLGLAPTEANPDNRLVILKQSIAPDVGILVEQGRDIVHTLPDAIEAAPVGDGPAEAAALVTGVCKFQSELIILLDLAQVTSLVSQLIR